MPVSVTGLEWESSNSTISHPFSESASFACSDGSEMPLDLFVDAFVHPVVEASEGAGGMWASPPPPRLVLVDPVSGVVELSFNGSVLSGRLSSGTIRLTDAGGRMCGVMVAGPGMEAVMASMREIRLNPGAELSSFAYCPILSRGVSGFSVDGSPAVASSPEVVFGVSESGAIRPVLSKSDPDTDGCDWTLRFDAYRRRDPVRGIIRKVYVAKVGNTPFDISVDSNDIPDGSVYLYTPGFDREDVCWRAHMEDAVSVVSDTCGRSEEECPPSFPSRPSSETWICPSASVGGISFVVDNMSDGYRNPVHITAVSGEQVPVGFSRDKGTTNEELARMAERVVDVPRTRGNGIRVSIPGTGVSGVSGA